MTEEEHEEGKAIFAGAAIVIGFVTIGLMILIS